MKHSGVIILSIFLIVGLAACASSAAPLPQPTFPTPLNEVNYITQTPAAQPSPTAQASPTPLPEGECPMPYLPSTDTQAKPRYRIEAEVDMEMHTVMAQELIVYPNPADEPMDSLFLVVDTNWQEEVFSLNHISLLGSGEPEYSFTGGYLHIPLAEPLPPGCTLKLDVWYTLDMPYQTGYFGFTTYQMAVTNWYPFFPPYSAESGWQANSPNPFGEYLVYPTADFDISLTFTPSAAGLALAAPAIPVIQDDTYTYKLHNARTFSFAVLQGYDVLEETVDGVQLRVLYQQAKDNAARHALQTLGDALGVYTELFGEYPFDSLTVAELEMYDGMEYDGLFFLGRSEFATYDYTARNMLTFLVAHETSHNWWFSQVANDQAIDPWLDEALATYCEYLFYERVYPQHLGWWWSFRITYYEPVGWVNATTTTYYDYEAYRQAVYLRGVQFLHALRAEMGDDLFLEFLRRYYQAGQYQVMGEEDFFAILEQVYPDGVDAIRWAYFLRR